MLDNIYKKFGKGKTYIMTAVVLIAINIITGIAIHQIKIRFTIDDERFRYISRNYNIVLFEDSKGNKVEVRGENYGFFSPNDNYKINYKNKAIQCDNSDLLNKGRVIILSDGSKYVQPLLSVEFGAEADEEAILPFDVKLVKNINEVYEYVKESPILIILLLTIPLIFLGLVNLIYPEKMWRFRYALTVTGGEPTDWAIWSSKIGGKFLVAVALLFPFTVLLTK